MFVELSRCCSGKLYIYIYIYMVNLTKKECYKQSLAFNVLNIPFYLEKLKICYPCVPDV